MFDFHCFTDNYQTAIYGNEYFCFITVRVFAKCFCAVYLIACRSI